MLMAFAVWSACACLLAGIGVRAWLSNDAVGFFAGVAEPKVKDVRKYNRAVAKVWIVLAAVMELLGLPLLTAKQNAPEMLLIVVAMPLLVIGAMVAYVRIENKYKV